MEFYKTVKDRISILWAAISPAAVVIN